MGGSIDTLVRVLTVVPDHPESPHAVTTATPAVSLRKYARHDASLGAASAVRREPTPTTGQPSLNHGGASAAVSTVSAAGTTWMS